MEFVIVKPWIDRADSSCLYPPGSGDLFDGGLALADGGAVMGHGQEPKPGGEFIGGPCIYLFFAFDFPNVASLILTSVDVRLIPFLSLSHQCFPIDGLAVLYATCRKGDM